jgi:hypothetical protein
MLIEQRKCDGIYDAGLSRSIMTHKHSYARGKLKAGILMRQKIV